jgi:glycerol uptake operon antiterminator
MELKKPCTVRFEQRLARLRDSPIIAAVNNLDSFQVALASPAQAVYVLFGTPLTLPGLIADAQHQGKLCMISLDFMEGLARDRHAIEYLASSGADGIVSTKFDALRAANTLGLVTILRTFIIDSAAVAATLKALSSFEPDAIEILPAVVAPKVVARFRQVHPSLHMIAGGLIETVREIECLFQIGVNSISVSDPRLWVI